MKNNYPEISAIICAFNEESTIENVLKAVTDSNLFNEIIVVNDGSTDNTLKNIKEIKKSVDITDIHLPENKGKGYALRQGFKRAFELGYEYAITIDSDGQHMADDLPVFIDKIIEEPGSLIVGARNMEQDTVPGGSSFGHKFSNFWYRFETGIKLPDTQSGFRLYPLIPLSKRRFFTKNLF